MEAQRITVSLIDLSAGYEATPNRVRLGVLADFAQDVSQLLRGETKEVDPAQLEVSVVEGSVAILTAPILAPQLFKDLKTLLQTELLDAVDRKRREVIERWQRNAKKIRGLAFQIAASSLPRPVVVSVDTDYRSNDADQWVQVERYIRGVIEEVGGAGRVNTHVRLPDGSTLTVATDRDLLRNDKVNRLYKGAMLRVKAQYNVLTRELRDAKLIEFVEYAPSVDEEALARMTKRGAQAWKDVADATSWVDQLRGSAS